MNINIPRVDWAVQQKEAQTQTQMVGCIRCYPTDPAPEKIYFIHGTSMCYTHAHSFGAPNDE